MLNLLRSIKSKNQRKDRCLNFDNVDIVLKLRLFFSMYKYSGLVDWWIKHSKALARNLRCLILQSCFNHRVYIFQVNNIFVRRVVINHFDVIH